MSSANSIFKMANKECKDKAPGPEADPVLSSLVSTPAAPPCIASPSELAPDQSNELCVSSDFTDCQQKVEYASSVLKSLGFDISPKSALTPSQEIHHLEFILNSKHMTVTLSGDKREHVETLINKVLFTPMITVRALAQTEGTLIACFPAIEYGQLYHRHLEILKINSLKTVYDFERLILLSEEAMSDLKWWLNDGLKSKKSLVREKPRATIKSDSSGYAWGAVMNKTDSGTSNSVTHGMWRDNERKEHINVLELKAAMLAVQSLCRELTDCHVRIEIDNTTAVAYITAWEAPTH
ncbi:transposon ty3-i Gag-Pol polyprotein [Plakobranchus ocellatus]|uniref:Transposon ty3-i Gag-Pol polyprotein n=1 Tax=Plakobranchus ocellatus TaxID=259542 RepID=A0AAV3XVU1_9GAST|nr:transposon ty3-i Gag-Pol polyprotein [Plakobranchus ocellatus]